jgi:hypothetical protein
MVGKDEDTPTMEVPPINSETHRLDQSAIKLMSTN